MKRGGSVLVLLLIVGVQVASAQDRAVSWEVAGGPTLLAGTAADVLDTGFGVHLGALIKSSEGIRWRIGGLVTRHDVKDPPIVPSGNAWIWNVSGDLIVGTPMSSGVAAYGIAGAGVYRRRVTLHDPPGTGAADLCDPWFDICTNGFEPIETIAGTRSSTELGFHVGAGVNFRAWPKASLFLEIRLHHIRGEGPGPARGAARTADANTQLIPVVFGVRF